MKVKILKGVYPSLIGEIGVVVRHDPLDRRGPETFWVEFPHNIQEVIDEQVDCHWPNRSYFFRGEVELLSE